jgi:hypothetical protein
MPAAGPDRATPGYRGGDIVNTFSSRNVEAADRLALARLVDDGAPPAVTWPQAGDRHEADAIRRGRIGQVAASQAQTAAIASGEVAEQTPALLGAVSTSKPPPRRQRGHHSAPHLFAREESVMPEPAAPHHGTTSTLTPPSANGSASWIGTAPIPPGRILSAPSAFLAGPPASAMHHATANCVRGFPGSGHEPTAGLAGIG